MAANLVRNDPEQTINASNVCIDKVEAFRQTIQAVATEISSSAATEGDFQIASMRAAEDLNNEVTRYTQATNPRLESIRLAAEDATRLSEEGSSVVSSIDTTI